MSLKRGSLVYLIASLVFLTGLGYLYFVIASIKEKELSLVIGLPVHYALIGLGLIYLSLSLYKKLYRAWLITVALLAFAILSEIIFAIKYNQFFSLVFLVALTCLVFISKNEFKAQSEKPKVLSSLGISIGLVLLAIIYGTLGFLQFNGLNHNLGLSVKDAVAETIRVISFTNDRPIITHNHSRAARTFVLSLQTLGLGSLTMAAWTMLKPLAYRYQKDEFKIDKARDIAEKYGGSSEDFFKFWPEDKDYIYSDNDTAFIAYKVFRGTALAVGGPIGDANDFDNVVNNYINFCHKHAFTPSFIHITDRFKDLFHKHGFNLQKIGEEAVVDTSKFSEQTAKSKNWRNVKNRFIKQGYNFEMRLPPHSSTLLDELKRISDDWLASPGRTERGFVLGYFDKDYLNNCEIGVLRNEENHIVGFVNLIESFEADEANMDLFRQRENSLTNTTDYMMYCLILELHLRGYKRFNLGLCPLVGMSDEDDSNALSKALNLVYNFGGKIYSFKGLYRFKSKFDPDWRDSYIAYKSTTIGIVKVAQSLNAAMKVDSQKL